MTKASHTVDDEDFKRLLQEASVHGPKTGRGNAWLNSLVMLGVTLLSAMFMPFTAPLDLIWMAMGANLMLVKDEETRQLGRSLLLVGCLNLAAALAFAVMIDK